MNEKVRKRMQVERRKANQREAGECLVRCDGTDNARLAVSWTQVDAECTQMMAIKTSLSRCDVGSRQLLQQGPSQLHPLSQQSAKAEREF